MPTYTLGQLLINEALPEDMRDPSRVWDKKTSQQVMTELANKHPDQYREVAHKLMRIGQSAATTGNVSYSLSDFLPSEAKKREMARLNIKIQQILDGDGDRATKNSKVVSLLADRIDGLTKQMLEDGVTRGSRLAELVHSGAKGSPGQYNTTVGAPLLFTDHRGDPIPIPVLRSASEGLDPVEFFASSYGTRRGVISTKFATQDAGAFSKQLGRAAHRIVVTEDDCGTGAGIVVDGYDDENIGTVLNRDIGDFKTGQVIGPDDIKGLRGKKIVVRSPATCQAQHGICAHCAGVRERGTFPEIGDNIGLPASQALSERLSQGSLNVKHGGGAAGGRRQYTFEDIDRFFQMPKNFPGSAVPAMVDGTVQEIAKSEAGGAYVTVNGQRHYVEKYDDILVKPGDHVEAGDSLSEGIINPKELARYRGIGAARRKFMDELLRITNNGISRRNAEVLARGVVSHVRVNDLDGPSGTLIGDLVRYDDVVRDYTPREGSSELPLSKALGKYLEKPTLHYTIGTKVSNHVLNDLKSQDISSIYVHDREPAFEPDVQRIYGHTQADPDWMVRLSGTELKRSLLSSVHEGVGSETHSTSYVPAIARGVEFGKEIRETGRY